MERLAPFDSVRFREDSADAGHSYRSAWNEVTMSNSFSRPAGTLESLNRLPDGDDSTAYFAVVVRDVSGLPPSTATRTV